MYYVIYVGSGKETRAEELVKNTISSDLFSEIFHPLRHMRKKIKGKWMDLYEKLLPGYVFLKSEKIEAFHEAVRKIPTLLVILGKDDGESDVAFYGLTRAEEEWLWKVTGGSQGRRPGEWQDVRLDGQQDRQDQSYEGMPVAELSSVGFDENDEVVILSGPLKDMTGQVKKINLHKRMAEVEIDFMGRKTVLHLGIEIIENHKFS